MLNQYLNGRISRGDSVDFRSTIKCMKSEHPQIVFAQAQYLDSCLNIYQASKLCPTVGSENIACIYKFIAVEK